MILWLLACTASGSLAPSDPDPFHGGAPSIKEIEWECDPEKGRWTFEVKTEQWTGGGYVWMAQSTINAEAHAIRSVGATADGSTDRLKLRLDVADRWRDARPGSSTRWLCVHAHRLSFMLTVYEPTSDAVADCRYWGKDASLWPQIDAAYDCETRLEGTGDTGEVADTGD